MKRFFYKFNGRVFFKAKNKEEAEKLLEGISLDNYLIDEEVYEIDKNFVELDLKKREEKWGTYLHPFDESDEYHEFRVNEVRFAQIFNEFLHGNFDKNELMKRIAEAEKENIDDFAVYDVIDMIDLESRKLKGVRHCFVD